MTNQQLAFAILSLDEQDMDEVLEYIYNSGINVSEYYLDMKDFGIDASAWCKRKHPPAG